MNKNVQKQHLPKREREVMEVIYSLDQGSVSDVQAQLVGQPNYSATRMLLQRLHKKGLLQAQRDGHRYIYSATTSKSTAARVALQSLLRTFFAGSRTEAVSALLGDELSGETISAAELDELDALVKRARSRQTTEDPGAQP